MRWDPAQYLRYADERGRPFTDLLSRIAVASPRRIADLGCGPGSLTATLLQRWPQAHVIGVDSSAEMIEAAEARVASGPAGERLAFVHADLRTWAPPERLDVLISNATLQWVPDHLALLARLTRLLAPGGWLAFQLPGNFEAPSHALLLELAESARWRGLFGDTDPAVPGAHDPATYLDALASLGLVVDAWETTYLHVLHGDDAVLEWMTGTGARPVLAALPEAERGRFLVEYGAALRSAYPRKGFGTVLPFRRIFVAAHT